MANSMQPTNLLATPFCKIGDKTIIPVNSDQGAGKAGLDAGFPFVTQKPISQGGVAPSRTDFNGILYMLSAFSFFGQSGGVFEYNETLDYDTPAIVFYGGTLWYCLKANGPGSINGLKEPGTDEEYWLLLVKKIAEDAKDNGVPIGGGFNRKQTITQSGTFTAPVSGTYRITCIGGGGGGGGGGKWQKRGGYGGKQGGSTSFGALLTAIGGSGGGGGGAESAGGANGAAGGNPWTPAGNSGWEWLKNVAGGTEEFSRGGSSSSSISGGKPGEYYGDGRSGGNAVGQTGGTGHSGVVVIRFQRTAP